MNRYGLPAGARVAVAMSGGVDSCVTAALLKDAGFDVFGVTMALWSCHRTAGGGTKGKTCCSTADVEDARAVCLRLGIPHVVADFRTEFREKVIEPFVADYAKARTPIPCIGCNQHFKFDRLWTTVRDDYGAQFIATGHYAQIVRDDAGQATQLLRGVDPKKDQSYYLFVMTRAQLQHSVFPLGGLVKTDVRAIAAQHGLVTADKPDSQEICFVPDDDYAGFIEDYYPDAAGAAGEFIDLHGDVLGRHRGAHAYTIGQRRGLGITTGERRYVVQIDPASRRVTLGSKDDLLRDALTANRMNWIMPDPALGATFTAQAKIRSNNEPVSCDVTPTESGVALRFHQPQSAVTPGQALVLYDGLQVLGGGWIV